MNQLSLRFKLYAIVVALLLIMGISMLVTAQLSLRDMEKRMTAETQDTVHDIVIDQLAATAGKYGEVVSGYFATVFRTVEVLRDVTVHNVQSDSSERMSRKSLEETVGALLEAQEELNVLYAMFEPNGYDGQDRYFTGGVARHSSEAEGVLGITYFRDQEGNLAFSDINPADKYLDSKDEFGMRVSEWYLCPMDTKRPCIIEPYDFELSEGYSVLMTSLVLPIMDGNQFVGVAGADIILSTLQKTIGNVSKELFDGQSRVTLISEQGRIVASSHYGEYLGRPLSEAIPEYGERFAKLHQGKSAFDDGETLAVSYPIEIKLPDAEWSLLIELPRDAALASVSEITDLLSEEVAANATRQTLVGIGVVVLALLALVILVRSVTRPLDEIRDRMKSLASAEGDLTRELKIDTHAELIELAGGFNAFLAKLREMINDLKNVNTKVREQAGDVGTIAVETDEQTGRQHQEIDSVVTAMNEMSAAAGEVAGFAGEAAENARMAQDGIRFTQNTLSSAVDGVSAVANDMGEASTAIGQVANRSEDINRILDVIRGIAEQTNLLALNAAIEAARAGEQGRGFAVVADEVRTLASRTRESTDEISTMIDGLKQDVNGAVSVIQSGVDRATSAVDGTQEAAHSLATVVDRIAVIVEHVSQVATAAEEQSSVSEEINRNLTRIGDAANDLRELAGRVKGSGQALDNEVQVLERELGRLRT